MVDFSIKLICLKTQNFNIDISVCRNEIEDIIYIFNVHEKKFKKLLAVPNIGKLGEKPKWHFYLQSWNSDKSMTLVSKCDNLSCSYLKGIMLFE